jgi:hypothetical protein
VSFGFSQLAMGISAADVARIDAALTAANGKRRTELRSAADVVAIALEVKGGAQAARRDADDRAWRKKLTTRSYVTLERVEGGGFSLAVGTESVASYSTASRLTTELTLAIPVVAPAPAPAGRTSAVEKQVDVTASLPHELRKRLEDALSGEPSTDRFGRAMTVLSDLKDEAQVVAAKAFAERYVSLWPDALRATSWQFSQLRWTPATRALPRKLLLGRDQLATHAEALGVEGRRGIVELELLSPLRRDEPDVIAADALLAFPSLHTLRFREPAEAMHVMRFPPSLRVLHPGGESLGGWWSADHFEWLVSRIASDAPQVERVSVMCGTQSLSKLPAPIELMVSLVCRPGDAKIVARELAGRPLQGLGLLVPMWADAHEEVAGCRLGEDLRELTLEGKPGQLEALLRAVPMPKLKRLRVELPARHARMHRRKPPDYTFTRGDVEALAAAPFLAQLDTLELVGVLGEALAEVLVAALARSQPKLTRLAFLAGEIGNDALQALIESGVTRSLQELELYRCKLKASGLALFAHELAPQRLEKLVLAKNAVAAPALEKFCAWPGLASVRRLDLREISFSPAQRELLSASTWIRREALDAGDGEFW